MKDRAMKATKKKSLVTYKRKPIRIINCFSKKHLKARGTSGN